MEVDVDGSDDAAGKSPRQGSRQAEKEAAHQKTRYDAAIGFVNVANIIADQDLLDKMSTAKMTKIALTKAETEYKAALQRAVLKGVPTEYTEEEILAALDQAGLKIDK
ncbi:hypothetical protein CEXT_382701, partial [Caerostris extrusa]